LGYLERTFGDQQLRSNGSGRTNGLRRRVHEFHKSNGSASRICSSAIVCLSGRNLATEAYSGRGLDFAAPPVDNSGMEFLGHVQNGVVVLDEGMAFPEGTRVSVSPIQRMPPVSQPTETEIVLEAGKLPYVRGGTPGTWNLTNEMIAQILDEEEIERTKGMWNAPS